MRSNLNRTNESQNEFMSNDYNSYVQERGEPNNAEEFQKMFQVFQKMAADPNLFMKMMSSVKPPESEEPRRRQFQVQQHKYRNHEVSPKRKQQDYTIPSKQNRKKGTNVLGNSYTQQQDSLSERYYQAPNDKLAESTVTNSNKDQHLNTIEDRPIQSNYAKMQQNQTNPKNNINQSSQNSVTQKYNADDERPIKSAKGYGYEVELNQSALLNNSSMMAVDPNKYKQAEERPIKGIQGDFKNYLMSQEGFPMTEQPQEDAVQHQQYEQDHQGKPRQFLKRGSRQFLSSAKDKSVPKPKPKPNKNQEKQVFNTSTNFSKQTSEKPERSISQNRVLGRKSVSSKSITKKVQKPSLQNEEKKILQPSHTTSNYNTSSMNEVEQGNRTPRAANNLKTKSNIQRDTSTSPTFPFNKSPKAKKQQKKKNIFQDSSSQDQQTSKSIKNTQYQQGKCFESLTNKTQVIPGIFLTKKQLHQILSKHGKTVPQKSSVDQQKIQQLKSKYLDLCNILTEQKQMFQQQIAKEKQQFELYKQAELAKLKNQKKVQQRNLMNNQKNKEKQKQKQDFEALKKVLEKEREQFKHKQKNYKLMIQKYKKLAEEKDKPTNQQPKYSTIQSNKNQQASSTANKKKSRPSASISQPGNRQNQEAVSNSYKGSEQSGNFMNKRDNSLMNQSDNYNIKNKNAIPNYQDLKKPNSNIKSNVIQQNSNQIKNQKYEYYEDYDHKQTVKNNNKYDRNKNQQYEGQQQINQERPNQDSDREEIVQYNLSMKLSDLCKIPLNIKMVTDEMIENLFKYQNNPQYRQYLELTRMKPRTKIHTARNANQKKTTNIYADGGKQVIFDTGVRKQYFNNGYVIIFFANGDIKQKLTDQTVLYFFKEKEVDQITLPNKINIYRFDNNQVEFHFQDKTVQIRHPDGTFKVA